MTAAHVDVPAPFAARLLTAATALSACLLFLVQPMTGAEVLPRYGGSAAVWTTCLLYFQTVLVAGYGLAHLLAARPPAIQRQVHGVLGLLALASAALPAWAPDTWATISSQVAHTLPPTAGVLVHLLLRTGLAYLFLATNGVLFQTWWRTRGDLGEPWRLYAWSNGGSLVGLLAFPLVLEPAMPVPQVGAVWAVGLAGLALADVGRRTGVSRRAPPASAPSATARTVAHPWATWLLLAAAPTAVLSAITQLLTSEVVSAPLLWVLPLTTYLCTLIVAFDRPELLRPGRDAALLLAALLGVALATSGLVKNALLQVTLLLFAVWAAGAWAHGEAYRRRPEPAHLTSFYLAISAGGALGGAFVALVAPRLFPGLWEAPLVLGGLTIAALWSSVGGVGRVVLVALAAGSAVPMIRPTLLAEDATRTFYGTYRVEPARDAPPRRLIAHGHTVHGVQLHDRPEVATAYYDARSGAVQALTSLRETRCPEGCRVGLIGLGAGTLATWVRPGDGFVFYEIDPEVLRLARTWFRFLSDAEARAPGAVEVAIGDARRLLEVGHGVPPGGFHLLVLDAFAGDSVPSHLATQEAYALFRASLAPGGAVAAHVSNRYLDVRRVVAGASRAVGLESVVVRTQGVAADGVNPSEWVISSDDPALRATIVSDVDPGPAPAPLTWRDGHAPILPIVRR